MQPEIWLAHVDIALELLPARLTSGAARAMMVAIALQESDLKHRRQIGGPALSYLMWEPGLKSGLPGVLRHSATATTAQAFLAELDYPTDYAVGNKQDAAKIEAIRQATVFDCTLSAGLGRLLLYTLPYALPQRHAVKPAYDQYIDGWRPGKESPERWPERYQTAWELVA